MIEVRALLVAVGATRASNVALLLLKLDVGGAENALPGLFGILEILLFTPPILPVVPVKSRDWDLDKGEGDGGGIED